MPDPVSNADSGIKVCGEPAVVIDNGVYAVTYPDRLSEQDVEMMLREWHRVMPNAKLIIFDGGAKITPLVEVAQDAGTPIYDRLLAERTVS